MKRILLTSCFCLGLATSDLAAESGTFISTGTLLSEMTDLALLAQWPEPAYRTVQFSSYDRRSTSSEAPAWFSNADGFGREPIPGFLKVLREPKEGQNGLYLVAEVNGPGALVRGWSAAMGGVMRVTIDPVDGDDDVGLIWKDDAYQFLARRSAHFLRQAGLEFDAGDAFVQTDADYLPIPFGRGLRITWEGKLNELHFYQIQVRLYPEGTRVQSFDPKNLAQFEKELRAAAAGLTRPNSGTQAAPVEFQAAIQPTANWTWAPEKMGPASIRELKVRVQAEDLDQALRGCLLRIAFDGSQRPQVEAPLGDFFASGPGVNPFSSLPFDVEPDGTFICRFVMPFEKSLRLEVVNHTKAPVNLEGSVQLGPWTWNERSLYFRAKWRADHDLAAAPASMDLPYVLTIGKGTFVGCAAMIMNPSGVPTAGGNWWGEGDEKFLVDGELVPSTFGTGSEDYFNYSWSRCDLFDHPYCGQPLDSGPDTAGYVSNHRFQVMDAIPFERSFAGLMELWTHRPTPGLSYARIAYHYARPGAVDDHRGLVPSDLRIVPIPFREFEAAGGASGATFHASDKLNVKATAGLVEAIPMPLATQLKVVQWHAEKGARLTMELPIEKSGQVAIHPVMVHQPKGAVVRFLYGGKALTHGDRQEAVSLQTAHATRVLNLNFHRIDATPGTKELVVECLEPGLVGLDYVWVK